MNLLDRPIVLRLNAAWQAIGVSSVKDALIAMNSGNEFLKAAVAIDIQYAEDENGDWDFSNASNLIPCPFEEWIKLPIRPFDEVIHTSKLTIRVPTVIIAVNYEKVHKVSPHPTKKAIRDRDGSRCQVTGRFLSNKEGNVDHNMPRCRGGRDTFENMVWMDKKLNSLKGNKTIDEMGWKLLRKPVAPKPIPVSATIKKLQHRDWRFFLNLE